MNRYNNAKMVGLIGILSNIFLLVIKFIVAISSHSQAIIADAINSFGDIFSSLMTYIGNRISSVKADQDHNFGHGKAEYIFSLLISIFMLFIASNVLISSIKSIFNHNKFTFSIYLVIICIITILVKFGLYLYTKRLYKDTSNILIKASMKDHRNDMLLTVGTLLSILLGYMGYYFFDGIFGTIISLYIMVSGIEIFLESYKILMDTSISEELKSIIIEYILSNKEIENISSFYTVPVGYKYVAIITIEVNGLMDTFKSHEIADRLECNIKKEFREISKVIVHVNPVEVKDESNGI